VPKDVTEITGLPAYAHVPVSNHPREGPVDFASRFSRCHHLLHFIACRVLGGAERGEDAIENCWRTASQNTPTFEYEGAFRSWLIRVLIDEALAILRENYEQKQRAASGKL
jgi:DNA-directed RNA polymerase specialized sigma24 family protein